MDGLRGAERGAHLAGRALLGIDDDVAEQPRVDHDVVRLAHVAEGQQQPAATLGQEVGQRAVLAHFRELRLFLFLGAQLLAHHVLGGDGCGGPGLVAHRREEAAAPRVEIGRRGKAHGTGQLGGKLHRDVAAPGLQQQGGRVAHEPGRAVDSGVHLGGLVGGFRGQRIGGRGVGIAAAAPSPSVAARGPATRTTELAPPAASTAMRLSSTRQRLFTATTFAGSYLPSAAACMASCP